MNEKKSCVLYARFSPRPDAEKCDSCEKQLDRCVVYAETKYVIKSQWSDEGWSGAELVRPGLSHAISELKPGWVLVVDRTDRLARDMLVGYAIRKQIADVGATIEYADGTPAGDSPEEKFLQGIMLLVAAFERDRIVARTKAGMDRKRKKCERIGQIPIGWMIDPKDPEKKQLVNHEEECRVIKIICQEKSRGYSIKEITRDLNCGSWANRKWNEKTVRRLWKKHRYWACPTVGDPSLEPEYPI